MGIGFDFTPTEYELQVKKYIEAYADDVYKFEAQHQEDVSSVDGDFNIDIAVRFKLMGVDWFIIIECKRHSDPIKRDVIVNLKGKKDSLRADKAMLFSTATFQSGAIEYAHKHRIPICQFYEESIIYFEKDLHKPLLTIVGIDMNGQAIKQYDPNLHELLQ